MTRTALMIVFGPVIIGNNSVVRVRAIMFTAEADSSEAVFSEPWNM
jgi:hypothetical protein